MNNEIHRTKSILLTNERWFEIENSIDGQSCYIPYLWIFIWTEWYYPIEGTSRLGYIVYLESFGQV